MPVWSQPRVSGTWRQLHVHLHQQGVCVWQGWWHRRVMLLGHQWVAAALWEYRPAPDGAHRLSWVSLCKSRTQQGWAELPLLSSPQLSLAGWWQAWRHCAQPMVPASCSPTQVFRWTGRNNFFMKGDADLLVLGGGR